VLPFDNGISFVLGVALANVNTSQAGAETVAAACPFCASMFRDALKTVSDKRPELLDIVQIVARGLDAGVRR
jgi:Fe-S oxidoreductase